MSPLSTLRSPLSALVIGLTLLSGCATQQPPCNNSQSSTDASSVASSDSSCTTRAVAVSSKRLQAVGHGAPGSYTQYNHSQQRLMAMRAAQIDAYRNLAEQVYGFKIWGSTSVSAFATQSDTVRSYVDAYIRGARVVNMTAIADGNFEATVELDLSQSFFDCLGAPGSCAPRVVSSCVAAGCTAPSASYYSN